MPIFSLQQIRALTADLSSEYSLEQYRGQHRLAAVLILIYQGLNEPEIILTRRSNTLPNYAGQISFPGGTVDESDLNPIFTALRETREEIALQENEIEILGTLDTTTLPSGFAVTPVLGLIECLPALTPNPDEVEEIFSIPLSLVCDLSIYGEDFLIRDGERRDFYYLNYNEYYIWGATAKMLYTLAKLLNSKSNS